MRYLGLRYLADTDWIIHALHDNAAIVRRLEELTDEGIGISIITTAELYQGAFYSSDPSGNEALLLEFINGYEVVQLDDEICRLFARERGRLKAGRQHHRRLGHSHRLHRIAARSYLAEQQSPPLRAA